MHEDSYLNVPDPDTEAELDSLWSNPWDAAVPEDEDDEAYLAWQRENEHDCPKQRFLDDPITQHYGVGSEFVGEIRCPVCDEE